MKNFLNTIYDLFIIVILAFLFVTGYSDAVFDAMTNNAQDKVALYGLIAFFVLLLIKIVVEIIDFVRNTSRDSYLMLGEDEGEISISNSSIEQTCEKVLNTYNEVVDYKIKTKIKNSKDNIPLLNVDIKCGLDEYLCGNEDGEKQVAVDGLCMDIQANIHRALEAFLGRKADRVNIKYHNVKYKEVDDKSSRLRRKKKENVLGSGIEAGFDRPESNTKSRRVK